MSAWYYAEDGRSLIKTPSITGTHLKIGSFFFFFLLFSHLLALSTACENLGSLTRDGTHASGIGRVES